MNENALTPEQETLLTWETRIKVLSNTSIWFSLLMAFGIPSVLLGIFFAFIAKRPVYALLVPLVALGGLLLIFVLVGIVIDLFGGFRVIFVLSNTGLRSLTGKVAKTIPTITVLAGLLAGKPGMVGTGLLAESEQNVFIPWEAITVVKHKAWRRFLLIKRSWGDKPIGLYCTPENHQQVVDLVRSFAGDKFR
jgi:hypothetical protein